jgi:hypothetical protein
MNEIPIQNLDGYLQSLRRLSGNLCDFWVEIFEVQNDVEIDLTKLVSDRSISLFDKVRVGYREIDEILGKHLFSKLKTQDDSLHKLFAWDIVEYIQLSYPSFAPEDDPISKRQSFVIDAESDFHGKYVYIVIPMGSKAVAIALATRA